MKCIKCGQMVPEDSVFCQYCGRKIEKIIFPSETTIQEPQKIEQSEACSTDESVAFEDVFANIDDMTPEEALNTLLKVQAKNTVEAMQANSKAQPDNEGDADFGLVPEKPIFTLAIKSVEGEEEYLEKLCTSNGEKIKYNRRGSTSVNGINGMIDIYETYLPSGQLYKTVYINMYGARMSNSAPAGFMLARKKDATPSNCTAQLRASPNIGRKQNHRSVLIAVVLASIALLSVIVTMNAQDIERNAHESWNPTAVYAGLIAMFVAFWGIAIYSLESNKFKILYVFSLVLLAVVIITIIEGSVFSDRYLNSKQLNYETKRYGVYHYYRNWITVKALNVVWATSAFLVSAVVLLPRVKSFINAVGNKWHSSIKYRENCYARVERIHSYYEKGIISKEEYERTKEDILKHIGK